MLRSHTPAARLLVHGGTVTWFAIQSLAIIVLAFVLGLLVGWLIWGLWRKVRFSESDALAAAGREYDTALADRTAALQAKDEEIADLTGRLGEAESAAGAGHTGHARKDELIAGQNAAIRDRDAAIAERDALLSERDSLIAGKDAALADRDPLLSERDQVVTERETEIARLTTLVTAAESRAGNHREELAGHQAAMADKDAEIA